MEKGFVLDEQALEAAGFHRKHGQFKEAAGVTSTVFRLADRPLTTAEVSVISHDWEQRVILACLAGIHVESNQNLAMMSDIPWDALSPLEDACWAICTVYRNPVFATMVSDIREDYWGRPHIFRAEMARGVAKTLEIATPLYHPKLATNLTNLAVTELQRAYVTTDNSLGIKSLISMERQIIEAKRGKGLDFNRLISDFNRLAFLDKEKSPACVATTASQLVAWGEKLGSLEAQERGLAVLGEITNEHPELNFILQAEKEGLDWEVKREEWIRRLTLLARLSSPWTHFSARCQKLYDNLTDKKYYIHAV